VLRVLGLVGVLVAAVCSHEVAIDDGGVESVVL